MAETKEDKNILNHRVVKIINGYLIDYFSFIVIYVVLVMFVVGYFYLLNQKYKNIIKNNELHQVYKKKEIGQLIGAVGNYQNYKNVYNAVSDNDKNKINNFLPSKDDSEELLLYMRNMLTRGGYQLLSLEVGPFIRTGPSVSIAVGTVAKTSSIKKIGGSSLPTSADQATTTSELGEIDISLMVGGLNYSALKNFLYFIERDSRFFNIEYVDFSLTEGIVDLKLKAYYLK
ncbi:hypothetical protein L6270_02625 [Candidatus Parcubacteria bacterium]|nr:hypothetical protein [Patescibacteria group bacterium]MBU4309919.1 hypothetical protein [Patescibacteria group bacterium]MBU4432078.1 hypothetical protein [Patescibacteria group bacterium]MBU4577844.1 hypothetical protein [Patescibacteria group bacterium]MCG2696905.1 hypothetical protein [Candidatus Parcubacteria bacterium]